MDKNGTIYYPQDEMNTALLPVTSGCAWNKCKFCAMYKDVKYQEIPLPRIENELQNMDLYTERVFLTGGDPLSIGFTKMVKLLDMIHRHLPYCACVASYAAIKSLARYTVEELAVLHDKGLRLLYIGFETGRDDILKLMNKGFTVADALTEATKLNQARLTFRTIIMYGIAGKGQAVDNAMATAQMINQFTTDKIITMNLMVMVGTELSQMVDQGQFIPADGPERLLEIATLLENLEPTQATVFDTTHPTNLIRLKGTLPQEKRKLLSQVARQGQGKK